MHYWFLRKPARESKKSSMQSSNAFLRLLEVLVVGLVVGWVLMGVFGVLFLVWPDELVRLIVPGDGSDVALLVRMAAPLVFLCGVNQPILATALVLKSSLRGAGATRLVMTYSFTTMIIFRGVLVPVAVTSFGGGLYGIWVIMFVDVAVQALLFSIVHFRGKWVETKV